ncbi:exosome complex exonuclease Rrp41 [Candidatus Woesearchaeota archaeon]|nr:exosome complex exonuclease Rrp41 [Candidatus Woesearchaeota archaeon]
MSYKKRVDGRDFHELRKIEAKVGIIPNARGSAYFKIGKTEAYSSVYGPRELYPSFLQDPTKAMLRCNYNMMPFSGSGDRVRPGPSRRSKEISMVTEKALLPVLDLDSYPNTVVDVFVELSQTDAGSRCAGICAASMALADAGIVMTDLISAVSVGKVDDKIVVDLDYEEEALDAEVSDIPVAMIPSTGEITLLQMDGIIDKKTLLNALKIIKEPLLKINEIQKKALKKKFEIQGAKK